jgi:hypothetical protein
VGPNPWSGTPLNINSSLSLFSKKNSSLTKTTGEDALPRILNQIILKLEEKQNTSLVVEMLDRNRPRKHPVFPQAELCGFIELLQVAIALFNWV